MKKEIVLQHVHTLFRGGRTLQTGYRRPSAGSAMTVLVLIGALLWAPLANAEQTPEAEASLPPQITALLAQLQAQIDAPAPATAPSQAQGLVDSLLIQLGLRQPTLAPTAGGFNPLAFLAPQTGPSASSFNPLAFLQPTQNSQSVLSSLFAASRMQPSTWGSGSAGGFGLPFAGGGRFSRLEFQSRIIAGIAARHPWRTDCAGRAFSQYSDCGQLDDRLGESHNHKYFLPTYDAAGRWRYAGRCGNAARRRAGVFWRPGQPLVYASRKRYS